MTKDEMLKALKSTTVSKLAQKLGKSRQYVYSIVGNDFDGHDTLYPEQVPQIRELGKTKAKKMIANATGLSYSTICRICKRYDIMTVHGNEKRPARSELLALDNKTFDEIADYYDVNVSSVARWFADYDIRRSVNYDEYLPQIKELADNHTQPEIADRLGLEVHQVAYICRKKKISTRGHKSLRPPKMELVDWIDKKGLTSAEMADHYGVSVVTIHNWKKHYGLISNQIHT